MTLRRALALCLSCALALFAGAAPGREAPPTHDPVQAELDAIKTLTSSQPEAPLASYVCAGYSNKEIARFLGKAESTVKHQVSACLRKWSGSAAAARSCRAGSGARNGLSSRMRLMAALR